MHISQDALYGIQFPKSCDAQYSLYPFDDVVHGNNNGIEDWTDVKGNEDWWEFLQRNLLIG